MTESPESVLARALYFRDALNYREVVALCDGESLAAWFREHCDATRPPNKEKTRLDQPQLSEEKLDRLFDALLARWSKYTKMPGTASYEEMLALTPEEFALRWFEHDDFLCDLRRRLRDRGDVVPEWTFPERQYVMDTPVPVADDLVRVSYWTATEQESTGRPTNPNSEELRRSPTGEWRLVARLRLLHGDQESNIIELPREYADLYDFRE